MRRLSALALLVSIVGLLTIHAPAWAEGPVRPCSVERLAEVRRELADTRRRTRIWSYTFAGAYAAIVAGSLTLSQVAPDKDSRIDYYFGVGGASIGILAALIGPLREINAAGRLEQWIGAHGTSDTCAALAVAERALSDVARYQEQAGSWIVHVGNVVFNTALNVGLGAGFGRWRSAFIQTSVGITVGEIMTLTHPQGGLRAFRRLQLQPMGPAGLMLRLDF